MISTIRETESSRNKSLEEAQNKINQKTSKENPLGSPLYQKTTAMEDLVRVLRLDKIQRRSQFCRKFLKTRTQSTGRQSLCKNQKKTSLRKTQCSSKIFREPSWKTPWMLTKMSTLLKAISIPNMWNEDKLSNLKKMSRLQCNLSKEFKPEQREKIRERTESSLNK